MTDNEQTLLDSCLDNLDVSRIHTCMTALDWRWRDVEGVPTIFDIRQFSRKLLKGAISRSPAHQERFETATGGFYVSVLREGGIVVYVDVKFCVAESCWDVDWSGE